MPAMPDHGRARGVIVRAIRSAQRRDLRDVAAAANVEASHLSSIETGRRRASPAATDRIARELGVATAVLCGQVPAIRTLREAAGISRQTLADAVAMKPSRLEHLERGLGLPTAEEAARLARRLGTDPRVFDTSAPPVDRAS